MLSKHISTTSAKVVVALVLAVVMVAVGAGVNYSASSAQQIVEQPQLTPTTPLNDVVPKLTGKSALLKPVAAMEADKTPDHSVVRRGSAYSDLRLEDEQDTGTAPSNPNIPSKALEPKGSTSTLDGFVYSSEIPLSRELQEFTYQRCQEMNLDYPVILALMWRESRFNPYAVGYNSNGTTDSGIMQINDVNRPWLASELGITNLLDPYENITAGTELLGRLAADHGQHYGLLAYQYGEYGMLNRVSSGMTTSSLTEVLYGKAAEFEKILASCSGENL